MKFLSRLIKLHLKNPNWRQYCKPYCQELTVHPLCDIQVNIPYNVKLKPLDVHKYHNCDLLKIELLGVKNDRSTVRAIQDGNNIQIFGAPAEGDSDEITCSIHAPVKANLNVKSPKNISCGVFHGSKLVLVSQNGNIFVEKFQGEKLDLLAENGNIVLKGSVVAGDIKLVANSGSIKSKRLQGSNVEVKVTNGNITVASSYCDNVIFEVKDGDMNLQNVHKNSKILVDNGSVNLTGLDGKVDAELTNSSAEIQISQILNHSTIKLKQNGNLKLFLSEECQDKTEFEIKSKDFQIDPTIKLIPSKTKEMLYLTPMIDCYKTVKIECENGSVFVHSASWIDMLKLNVK